MKLKLLFDDPNYNEIIDSVIKQVFPRLNDKHADTSFMPILKESIEIVKELPAADKGRFVMYMLDKLFSSKRSQNLFRGIEKICKSTIGVVLTISNITIERKRLDGDKGRITIIIELENVDYKTLMDKLFEIKAVDDAVPDIAIGAAKLASNVDFIFEGTVLPVLNLSGIRDSINGSVTKLLSDKTGIHLSNFDYEF